MRNKRIMVTMMTGVMMAGTIGTGTVQADSAEKVTLKIMNYKTEIVDALKNLEADYEAEFPEVDLVIETVSANDYYTTLKSKLAAEDMPDIFSNLGGADMDTWIEHMEDLSDEPWVENLADVVKPAITKDGKLYGMPVSIEGYGFVYNKDLFAQAGITEVPTTLTGLKEAVDKLNAAGIVPFAASYSVWGCLGKYGGNNAIAKQPEGGTVFVDALYDGTATFVDNEVFDNYFDLLDLEIQNTLSDPISTDYNTQVTLFASGEAAMVLRGTFIQLMCDEIDPELNLGLMGLPLNDDAQLNEKIAVGASNYWVINKNSEVKQEAKNFLNWLVTSETGIRYISQEFKFVTGMSNIEVNAEEVGKLNASMQEYIETEKTTGIYWNDLPSGFPNQMGTTLQKYVAGEADRAETLQTIQDSWDSFMTE